MNPFNYYEPAQPAIETEKKPKRRARGKHRLTARGLEVLALYREAVATAQNGAGGRDALEASQAKWASNNGLEPTDAIVMAEIDVNAHTILEITRSLDDCGVKRPTVEASIDRLSDGGYADIDEPKVS